MASSVKNRIIKPKTHRAKRALLKREPKVHENDKTAMFIKGGRTSEVVTSLLTSLHMMKKPGSVLYKKKNILRPFEDSTSIEFFSKKADASIFMFGSHSKKRPHNIVIGRLFDAHILDMIELGMEKYKPMAEFHKGAFATGNKPCLVFTGEVFDQDHEHKRLKNLFIDFFKGPKVQKIRLQGIEHVLQFTAADGKIFLRSYRILFKKSGSRTPRVELEEVGPSVDFVMRRTQIASDDLFKRSTRQPKEAKIKTKKNISHDPFGTKEGRIHMQRQDFNKLQTRKMKALKRKSDGSDDEPDSKKTPSDDSD